MNFHDLLNSCGEINSEFSFDVSLDYNSISSDLMTSDVFDSVFPLEETPISPELDNNSILDFENDDINMFNDTSLQVEEIYSPRSTVSISDSEKSSVYTESADESVSSGANQSDDPLLACMNPSEIIKVVDTTNNNNSPLPIIKQNIKPTKIILQNPNNKKIVTKPFIHSSQLTPAPSNVKPKKIFKVHNITSNGRSVLLPLNLKSIKILNASDLKTENIKVTSSTSDVTNRKIEHYSPKSIEEEEIDGVSSTESQYPPLNLTNEEKRLLSKEGIQLPTHYPLTKNEERELKRIRRKIRNKISAQDSRKRKKEYVDGLEERVKRSSEEKKFLLQRIKQLQRQNNKLMSHFSKLQSLLFKSSTSKATPSTCVMVVLLSALLVSLPNIRLTQKEMSETEPSVRRSLLSSQVDEDLHMDEFLVFKDDIDLPQELIESENITEKELNKMVEYAEKGWKDKDSFFTVMMDQVNRWLGKRTVRNPKVMFDEPDIDEEPPLKRTCFGFDKLSSIGAKEDSVEVVTSFIIKDTEKK